MSDKNPYAEMTSDVLNQHLEQLKSVVKEKNIDVTQFFGAPQISSEDQAKIDQHESLTNQIKSLTEASASKELSDTEAKLAAASVDRVVSDIKSIDSSINLDSVLNTNFNNLEKYDILTGVKPIIEKFVEREQTLRKEFGTTADKGETVQKFSEPEETSTAAQLVEEVIKANPGIIKEQ